jgi:hypothetical protein
LSRRCVLELVGYWSIWWSCDTTMTLRSVMTTNASFLYWCITLHSGFYISKMYSIIIMINELQILVYFILRFSVQTPSAFRNFRFNWIIRQHELSQFCLTMLNYFTNAGCCKHWINNLVNFHWQTKNICYLWYRCL